VPHALQECWAHPLAGHFHGISTFFCPPSGNVRNVACHLGGEQAVEGPTWAQLALSRRPWSRPRRPCSRPKPPGSRQQARNLTRRSPRPPGTLPENPIFDPLALVFVPGDQPFWIPLEFMLAPTWLNWDPCSAREKATTRRPLKTPHGRKIFCNSFWAEMLARTHSQQFPRHCSGRPWELFPEASQGDALHQSHDPCSQGETMRARSARYVSSIYITRQPGPGH